MPGADDGPAYEVVVVGGGLAGLTAALLAARYGHLTLVLESAAPGGHLLNVEQIEDFPGFPEGVAGYDLGPLVQEQAERQGASFRLAVAEGLEPVGPDWRILTAEGGIRAGAVVVASGSRPKPLGVPGEAALEGRGISHCATCDGPLFRGRVVGVAGGADWALPEALTLAGFAARVILLDERPEGAAAAGQETFRRRLAAQPAIEVRPHTAVEEVLGDGALHAVRLRDVASGAASLLELAGLFVYAGLEPNTAFLRDRLPLDPDGRVPTDAWMRTALPGVFAAGDVRQDSAGHAVTAAGDGATAAVAAHRYLQARGASSGAASAMLFDDASAARAAGLSRPA
jgi:thioredoxin reductase (NADPH)